MYVCMYVCIATQEGCLDRGSCSVPEQVLSEFEGPGRGVREGGSTGAALPKNESCNFSGFSDVRKTQHFFSEMFFGHCSDTLSTRGNTVATTRSRENYHKSSKRTSENTEKLQDSQFVSAGICRFSWICWRSAWVHDRPLRALWTSASNSSGFVGAPSDCLFILLT